MHNLKQTNIDIEALTREEIFEVSESQQLNIRFKASKRITLEKTIKILSVCENIFVKVDIKVVADHGSQLKLRVEIIAKNGIKNITAELEMRALILDERSIVQFVPVLEIDEKEVNVDHKASIGPPDKEWIFYMKSRGLSGEILQELIVGSFVN